MTTEPKTGFSPSTHTPGPAYLLVLFGEILLGSILSSLIVFRYFPILSAQIGEPGALNYIQILSSLLTFVAPCLLNEWIFRKNYARILSFSSGEDNFITLMRCILFYASMMPLIAFLTHLMGKIEMPHNAFTLWLDQIEAQSNAMMQKMMSDKSAKGIFRSLLSIVVVAPFAEELFMRGSLLGWLRRKGVAVDLGVWIVAALFSLVHFQWTAFIPRLLMGAALGYIAIYGGLWMAMVVHALNNLYALITFYRYGIVNELDMPESDMTLWILAPAILLAHYLFAKLRSGRK